MKRYNKECETFLYSAWAEPLGMTDCLLIPFSACRVSILCEAGRVGLITGRFPSFMQEDLDDLAEYIDSRIKTAGNPWNENGAEFFVRLDDCSPKDNNGGLRPLQKGSQIISQILTSKRCMLRIESSNSQRSNINLVLKIWRRDIDIRNEFRVFVVEQKVTAVSQYHWFEDCGWGREPKKSRVPFVIMGICQLFDNIKELLPFRSCVYDTHVKFLNDDVGEFVLVELIEFNPWGAHVSSGSALFHWIRDFDILNGLNRNEGSLIYVRFVLDNDLVKDEAQ